MKRAVLALASVLLAVPAADRPDMNWPQWRGPGGLGISQATDYPTGWAAQRKDEGKTIPAKNIAWKTEIPGRGHSSPIIWGDRIFITTAVEGDLVPGHTAPDHLDFNRQPGYLHPDSTGVDHKNTLRVLAYDARDGKLLWEKTAYDGLMYDNRHKKNTYASPSVVTDGKLVYAFFEAAGLYVYDVGGTQVWSKSLGDIAKAGLGPGTSPILYENLLILQIDQEMGANSAIVALDKTNGKEIWRADRTTRRSWATPLLVTAGGRTELVASGAEVIVGYDPKTGKELWHAPGTVGHPIPSAVAGDGVVIVTAGSSERAKRAFGIRLGANGDLTKTESVLWQYNKGTAYVPSPILVGDYVYLMTDTGILTCMDVKSGKIVYEGGRPPVPATFTASLVAFGDKLLQTSEDGDTFVVQAGPKHAILATNPLDEPVYASAALAGGTIYIRGEKHLFAIRNPQ